MQLRHPGRLVLDVLVLVLVLGWESWYINLGGNPQKPTLKPKHTVMYFLGAEHLALAFKPMWDRIGEKHGNNHKVAAAYPNDSDGNAFRAVFPAVLKDSGYTLDLSSAYAMGNKVYNIATDSWWVPTLPWHSSLTSDTCPDLAAAYTAAGYGQANANISNYTLFEIAYAALSSVNNPHDKQELSDALFQVKLDEAVAGPIDYTSSKNPAPGVAITPPVGIQWQKGTKYPLEAVVVDNTLQPNAKITGDLLPTFS